MLVDTPIKNRRVKNLKMLTLLCNAALIYNKGLHNNHLKLAVNKVNIC